MSGAPAYRLDLFHVVLVVVWGSCVSGAPAYRLDLFHVVLAVVGGGGCLGPLHVGWTSSM